MSSLPACEPASVASLGVEASSSSDRAPVSSGQVQYCLYPCLRLDGLVCARYTASGELLCPAEDRRRLREHLELQCTLFGQLEARAQATEADFERIRLLLQNTDRLNAEAQEAHRARRAPAQETSPSKRWASGCFRH